MKLTKETLKRIIKEELEAVQQEGFLDRFKKKTPKKKEMEEVPQEAKEALFAKLVAKGYADPKMGHSADDVSTEEVEEGSKDYEDFKEVGLLVTIDGKHYVGEY